MYCCNIPFCGYEYLTSLELGFVIGLGLCHVVIASLFGVGMH